MVGVGVTIQLWVVMGEPPVQPEGELVNTARVCVPLVHVPHVEYVKEVQDRGAVGWPE
ncbi:MAG: hypothetical protein UU95_C0006G0001 [Parcubacteria group bacterium GW2011_GWC2_42_12]|nr:MAG: hypothetical protein UU95_C0006G0001 [Parcubacteria group bacterium GW2011_GWC2_42_12]